MSQKLLNVQTEPVFRYHYHNLASLKNMIIFVLGFRKTNESYKESVHAAQAHFG